MSDSIFSIFGVFLILVLMPFVLDDASGLDYKKHVTAEDLGILQLAAHDLFNVDRCLGNPECSFEHEDGKLNLSTLFVDTINEMKPGFSDNTITLGGEHRNRENIMVFTVASALGEKYVELVNSGMDSNYAKNLIVTEYHIKLADAYKRTFGEQFPSRDDSFNPLQDRFQENLALRTIHDFLPGKIKVDNRFFSTLDSDLRGQKLNEKDLKQKSSKLDGKFDEEFLNINICLDPPKCDVTIRGNLLDADKSFGEQFGVEESFDDLLEELKDGVYDESDRATFHIRNLMAKGQNF